MQWLTFFLFIVNEMLVRKMFKFPRLADLSYEISIFRCVGVVIADFNQWGTSMSYVAATLSYR